MASEIGSMYGSEVHGYSSNSGRFKCDAWILGKYFANKMQDFSPDVAQSIIKLGKPMKTTLKLSPNGLSVGEKLLDKLKANGALYEHFELERLVDIYQDRKYANVVVCVLKSRLPDFVYEIYTYSVRRVNDAVTFENLFKEIFTGEKEFTNKSVEKIYGVNTLRLSELKQPTFKPTGTVNSRPPSNYKQVFSRSETNYSRSPKYQPTVVYTGNKQIQNNRNSLNYHRMEKKANISQLSLPKQIFYSNTSTQTNYNNSYFDNAISSIGSKTVKTFRNQNGQTMADVVCYVESQEVDNEEYGTKAKAFVGRTYSPSRSVQNHQNSYVEKRYSVSPSKQYASAVRMNYLTKPQNFYKNSDIVYGKPRKKESQTHLMSISDSSSSSENIATRPQIVYNSNPHTSNNHDYSFSNHYNYRYNKNQQRQPTAGTIYAVVNTGSKDQRPSMYNQNEQIYYLRAPL